MYMNPLSSLKAKINGYVPTGVVSITVFVEGFMTETTFIG